MKTKIICMCSLLLILITGCGKDDEPAKELILEKNAITLYEEETAFIAITSGNGNYKVSSSNEAVAIANSSGKIEVIAKSYGTTTITVTDAEYKKATITVTVNSGALKDTELRFQWEGLKVLLDETKLTDWGKTRKYQASADIGIVNLAQKKSLRTQGLKDYGKGIKSNIKLLIIENGATEQTFSLDKFEILDVSDGIFTAVGSSGTKKLVIRDIVPK
ncbi:MAG: Ig-like domain-containing protein [Paludibacteraceae bacterium]